MLVKTLPLGPIETNCYVVTNENSLECVVIDPGDESNTVLDYVESNHLKLCAILLTHGHFDHVMAVESIYDQYPVPIYMNSKDDARVMKSMAFPLSLPADGITIDDGDVIEEAGLKFRVLSTPGHTPGSVTFLCEDAMFTGDTLFRGSCGRTDLEGGDMNAELASIKKLCMLEGDYEMYPGHMDSSSLAQEKALNYYCRLVMSN